MQMNTRSMTIGPFDLMLSRWCRPSSPLRLLTLRIKPADRAWVDKCITDRKAGVVKLRPYCTCMQQIVEDNQPYGVAELSVPSPAHWMCWRDAAAPEPGGAHSGCLRSYRLPDVVNAEVAVHLAITMPRRSSASAEHVPGWRGGETMSV